MRYFSNLLLCPQQLCFCRCIWCLRSRAAVPGIHETRRRRRELQSALTAAEKHFTILLPGCFWTEASVDTFDDEFLCCTELPEEASNGWEQAASRSTRSASSGSPPNHRRPLKAGLDTSAGTSTSQAKPAEFSSHSGPLRKGSGAERTQSPESPDERTEYAEQQHQQNQQNDPQLLRNDLPVAQPLVGPASNHSKLRRGSKTTAGRSKDARDRARESEKARVELGICSFLPERCRNGGPARTVPVPSLQVREAASSAASVLPISLLNLLLVRQKLETAQFDAKQQRSELGRCAYPRGGLGWPVLNKSRSFPSSPLAILC